LEKEAQKLVMGSIKRSEKIVEARRNWIFECPFCDYRSEWKWLFLAVDDGAEHLREKHPDRLKGGK